jgi:CRP-like cAMP-binding protein
LVGSGRFQDAHVSRHLKNFLLARLDENVMAKLTPHLAVINLEKGQVLSETHSRISKVYFPHGGIISCVVELIGGGAIETGMVGKDGQFGAECAMDHKVSLNHVVVQVAHQASVIESTHFRRLAEDCPAIRVMALAYENFMLAQIQQTVACNAIHKVPARTCRWLLRMHRLIGDDLPLTQEFLAQMMGVRRTSVTEVAAELQRNGLISYHRGRVRILDVEKIVQAACECDGAVNAYYERAFGI